jgi:hypothetical protein
LNTLHACGPAAGDRRSPWRYRVSVSQAKLFVVVLPALRWWPCRSASSSRRPARPRACRGARCSAAVEPAVPDPLLLDVPDAATVLAPGSGSTSRSAAPHMPILLLGYVSALMFVMRHFADRWQSHRSGCSGSVRHGPLGLLLLSMADSPITASSRRRCGARESATCGRPCSRRHRSASRAAGLY